MLGGWCLDEEAFTGLCGELREHSPSPEPRHHLSCCQCKQSLHIPTHRERVK